MKDSEAIKKLNSIDWRKGAKLWDRLLMSGDKILTKNKKIATDIICYIAGEPFEGSRKDELLDKYRNLFHVDERAKIKLPEVLS